MKNIPKILSLVSIISLFITSCASAPENNSKPAAPDLSVLDTIQGTLDNTGWAGGSPPNHQLPTSVTDALLPTSTTNLPAGAIEKIEPRFDVAVNRANARSFFISLVKGTPYNIVVHPEVTGKITLNLQDVTIPEVMEIAYSSYGYEYEKISNGFIVHPNKIQTKIFKINYLNVTREGQSATRVSSGQPTENSNSSSTGSSGSTRQTSSQTILAASNIKTESKLDFWAEIEAAIGAIIGNDEAKSVIISPQSGLIIIRAYPSELRKAQDFLQSAEIIMQRQVILEAKIIEVELKDGYQQGINWASLSDSGNTLLGQTGGGTLLQDGTSIIGGSTGNLDPSNYAQIAGNAVSAFGGMFTLAVKSGNFAAFFEFLETQGNMQVLSSPRVSTINNQKAVIKVGSDEFFLTDISTTTTTGVTTTTTPDITLTPFFSGISLDVTPQIDENGSIILHIHPTISDVVDQTKVFTIADQTLSLPLAFSQVRESDSIVYAKNGEIVVIGGLMTNKLIEKESGTPFLSSIPILGNLFKHISQEEVKSELVILLKPIVIDNADSWSKVIGESSSRVKQLYHEYKN